MEDMVRTEGVKSLFRGLTTNVVGIIPARAIYFSAYTHAKRALTPADGVETSRTHMGAAACAAISTSTATNPIWVLKTRLQLARSVKGETTIGFSAMMNGVRDIYHTDGIRGFYRGLTSSYAGTCETIIHFVLYEKMKAHLRDNYTLSQTQGNSL